MLSAALLFSPFLLCFVSWLELSIAVVIIPGVGKQSRKGGRKDRKKKIISRANYT